MEKEIWKDVPNYEGYYQVSSLGRIKGVQRVYWSKVNKSYALKKRKNIITKKNQSGIFWC